MNRSTTVEFASLNARIERLKREEKDLSERVRTRVSALESEGRWVKSDPLYQSLFFALAGVHRDLRIAEKQLPGLRSSTDVAHVSTGLPAYAVNIKCNLSSEATI